MQLTTKFMAAAFALGTFLLPLQAQAGNNAMQQMMVLNNVNAQEQRISGQISAYVGSGQLSPQQAAAFNSELSQISSQAMMGGAGAVTAMNELNSLSSQINSSLGTPGQYVYGAATNPYLYGAATNPYVYGAATNPAVAVPGFYNNWRSNLAAERNAALAAQRNAVSAENQAIHQNNMAIQHQNELDINARNAAAAAELKRYNNVVNTMPPSERANYRATHPAPTQR